jgi:ribonuclease E
VLAAASGLFGIAVLAAVAVISGLGAVPVATMTVHQAVPIMEQPAAAAPVVGVPAPVFAIAAPLPMPAPAAAPAAAAASAPIKVAAPAPKPAVPPKRPTSHGGDQHGGGHDHRD